MEMTFPLQLPCWQESSTCDNFKEIPADIDTGLMMSKADYTFERYADAEAGNVAVDDAAPLDHLI